MATILQRFISPSDTFLGHLWPAFTKSLLITGTYPYHVHAVHALHMAYAFSGVPIQLPHPTDIINDQIIDIYSAKQRQLVH